MPPFVTSKHRVTRVGNCDVWKTLKLILFVEKTLYKCCEANVLDATDIQRETFICVKKGNLEIFLYFFNENQRVYGVGTELWRLTLHLKKDNKYYKKIFLSISVCLSVLLSFRVVFYYSILVEIDDTFVE